jgi:hypothetical protein
MAKGAYWDIIETRSGELDVTRKGRGIYYGAPTVRDALKHIIKHRKYNHDDTIRVQLKGEIRRGLSPVEIKQYDWL